MKTKQIDKLPFPVERVEGLISDIKSVIMSKVPSYSKGEVEFKWSGIYNGIQIMAENPEERVRGNSFTVGLDPFMLFVRTDCRSAVPVVQKPVIEVSGKDLVKLFDALEPYRCFIVKFDIRGGEFKFNEIIYTPKTELRSITRVIWHEEEVILKNYFESWLKTLPVLLRGEMKIWWNDKTKLLNFNLRTKKNHLRWVSDGNFIRWVILNEEKPGHESISHFNESVPEKEFGLLIKSFVGCKSFKLFYNYNGS